MRQFLSFAVGVRVSACVFVFGIFSFRLARKTKHSAVFASKRMRFATESKTAEQPGKQAKQAKYMEMQRGEKENNYGYKHLRIYFISLHNIIRRKM